MDSDEHIFDDYFLPSPTGNGLKLHSLSEPHWLNNDYAKISDKDLFSEERWGKTVIWEVLYEHAKSISNIINLLDEDIFPSTLFDTYLDILKANLNVFGNIFYFLTGEKMIKDLIYNDKTQFVKRILHRLEFWNLDCITKIENIRTLFLKIDNRLIEILSANRMGSVRSLLDIFTTKDLLTDKDIVFGKYRAYEYAFEEYKYPFKNEVAKNVAEKFKVIDTAITNYYTLFGEIESLLPHLDFNYLLAEFRKSDRGKSLVKAWARDMEGSRERLIDNLEKDPKLGLWVYSYLHLRDNEDVVSQLFYNENTGEIADKEKCYNTDNWISILTIAAILQAYDEKHKESKERDIVRGSKNKKSRKQNSFIQFIIDPTQKEFVLKRLHKLIDRKPPKMCALTIFAAQKKGLLTQPSYKALHDEFPEIGDRANYSYYLKRKDNYKDDIDAIEKGL